MTEKNTRCEVLTFFVALLQKIFPLVPVRKGNQKAPTTNELNIVVTLLAERSLGDEVVFLPQSKKFSNAGIRESTLNIQAIGDDSVEMLNQLQYQLEMPSIVDICSEANVAVNDFGDVQDLTMALDENTWQERASIDMIISYSRELLEEAPWFSKIEINGVTGSDEQEKPEPPPTNTDDPFVDVEITGTLMN